MFQPQPTPYSPFVPYGVGNPSVDFPTFQSAGGGSVVDSGGPTVFRDPIFSPVNTNASTGGVPLNYNSTSLGQQSKMNNNDMEEQEALARDFQPSLEGPLVGPKKSSQAIAEEYAKADPIYIAKTAALPQKYSHFRPILGDGNCGWRAAGFSYFETLLRLRSRTRLEQEITRMTSLNNLLETAGGFESWLFEDMVSETISLLKDLADSLPNPQLAAELLIQRFNNPEVSNAIVYHLRLLASSWLKFSADNYRGFIPDEINGVEGYCKELQAPDMEIDHLGMSLLIDVLLKQVGIAVEILYLDRSQGAEVTSHIIQAMDDNGTPTFPGGPMIHLLYRPGHYDILYNDRSPSISLQQPMEDTIQASNLQVNRATNFSQHQTLQNTPGQMNGCSNLDMTTLLSIPGFQCQPPPSHHGFPSHYAPIEQPYTASPISASPVSPGRSPGANSSASGLSLSTTFSSQQPATLASPALNTSQHTTHPTFPPTTQLPIHSHTMQQAQPVRPPLSSHPSLSSHNSDLSPVSASSSFRPSKYEWEAAADWQEPVVFQTSTFKNSHYNTAHYNNPNFQPEEWSPECEEVASGGGGVARKRST